MNKFQIGDKVRLKDGVVVGNGYDGVILYDFMVFNGTAEICSLVDGYITLSAITPYLYSEEMLEAVEVEK